jgi:single-stranded DNA-specific DHH superfamily exonuclease
MDSCFSGGLEYKEVGISRVEDKVDIERVDGIELKTTSVEQNLDELKEDFKMLYEDIEDNTTKFSFFSQSLQGQNRILIAACEEFEQAYGIKNHHGLFTLRAKEVLERLGHTKLTYIDFIDEINATPLLTTEQNPRLIPRNSQWAHKKIFTHN